MANKEQIRIEVTAQTTKAQVDLKKLGKQVDDVGKKTKKTEKQFGRWRIATEGARRSLGALRNNLLLVSFALGGTVAALGKMLSAYGQQELAERKLQQALGFTSQALLDQASALQQQTTFGDEAIIGVQSIIAAFTKDEHQIKELTKATLDLASAKGMDLRAAADLVAKSFGSSTNALSRYGIEADGVAGSTERLESLTQNVSNLFGGQARADLDTYTGRVQAMKNALGDTAESMGALLAPLMVKVSKLTKNAAEFWSDYFSELDKTSEKAPILTGEMGKVSSMLQRQENALALLTDGYKEGDITRSRYMNTSVKFRDEIERLKEELKKLKEAQFGVDSQLSESEQAYLTFAIQQQERLDKHKEEQEFILMLQSDKGYKGVAESLGLLTDEQKKAEKERQQAKDDEDKRLKDLDKTRERFRKQVALDSAEIGRLATQDADAAKDAAIDKIASYAMSAAAKQMEKIITKVPFPFNIPLAAAGGLAIGASVGGLADSLKAAQYGMNEVVNQPTLILAGEAGAEQVSITPLESPNIEGVQGGGASVTVNVSGNVLTSDFVEGELAENIREAVRRGADFGMG